MTDAELEMWQYLDESRDKIETLEKEVTELRTAFTVVINLLAEKMEIDNGLRSKENCTVARKFIKPDQSRWS